MLLVRGCRQPHMYAPAGARIRPVSTPKSVLITGAYGLMCSSSSAFGRVPDAGEWIVTHTFGQPGAVCSAVLLDAAIAVGSNRQRSGKEPFV